MSTRKGQFVTLRALREETGRDAARFFYVLRKSDQALDFDLSLATSESNDNPVYYVQYAHARVHSVITRWGGDVQDLAKSDLGLLGTESEILLAQQMARFPEVVDQAALDLAPHSIAFYLRELAASFHSCYNSAPFIVSEQPELTRARLALAYSSAAVLRQGLSLLGVSAPNQM